ncbi:hypothetical protein BJ170DRAFT_679276 [Xylariales sp. AK1849]|nr:hypothetical protein BJ170DRAFT_679276 [Xylariales sp. AK1849]
MSSIVNKVKDALHSDKSHETSTGSAGPHGSKAANAADPRIDSDRDHRANPGYGNTSTHTTTGAHTGTHDPLSSHGNTGNIHSTGTHTGTQDPLSSHGNTGNTYSTGTHTGTQDPLSSHGNTGNTYSTGTAGSHPEGSHGPHSSKIANAADPRIDSDRDHRANPYDNTSTHGTTGLSGQGGNTYGTNPTHGSSALGGSTGAYDSSTTGHGTTGHNTTGHGTTGHSTTGHSTTGHGTTGHNTTGHNTTGHSTTGQGVGGAHLGNTGPGPAPNTAGPHKSDALNKADPRVDSDLDGSKTYGGNKTHGSSATSATSRDPTDAAQVPPSVMRQHIGEPTIGHSDHGHGRDRRNSLATAQETHRGI